MKIIKDGRVNDYKPKHYTCKHCKSVLEVARTEMARGSDRDSDYYMFRCLVCLKDVFIDAAVVER